MLFIIFPSTIPRRIIMAYEKFKLKKNICIKQITKKNWFFPMKLFLRSCTIYKKWNFFFYFIWRHITPFCLDNILYYTYVYFLVYSSKISYQGLYEWQINTFFISKSKYRFNHHHFHNPCSKDRKLPLSFLVLLNYKYLYLFLHYI